MPEPESNRHNYDVAQILKKSSDNLQSYIHDTDLAQIPCKQKKCAGGNKQLYIHTCIHTYKYVYVCAQRLGFAQALQHRGLPFTTSGSCNFTFNWEDHGGMRER